MQSAPAFQGTAAVDSGRSLAGAGLDLGAFSGDSLSSLADAVLCWSMDFFAESVGAGLAEASSAFPGLFNLPSAIMRSRSSLVFLVLEACAAWALGLA